MLLQFLQNADLALARTGPATAPMERQRLGQVLFPFQLTGQGEQQPGVAAAQPGVVALWLAQQGQYLGAWQARLQLAAAVMQVPVQLEVLAAGEAAGFRGDVHAFVAEDAQLRQHELFPALGQVAEEHQSQVFAQLSHLQGQQALGIVRAPLVKTAGVGIARLQAFYQLGFAQSAQLRCGRKQGEDLVLAQ